VVSADASPDGVKLTVHVDAANNQGLVDKDRNYDPQTGANSSLEVALVKDK